MMATNGLTERQPNVGQHQNGFFEFKALPEAGASSPAIHSERFNTRATHIQCCPGQPRKFPFLVLSPGNFLPTELEARPYSAMSALSIGESVLCCQ
jgi:hypothetical protein